MPADLLEVVDPSERAWIDMTVSYFDAYGEPCGELYGRQLANQRSGELEEAARMQFAAVAVGSLQAAQRLQLISPERMEQVAQSQMQTWLTDLTAATLKARLGEKGVEADISLIEEARAKLTTIRGYAAAVESVVFPTGLEFEDTQFLSSGVEMIDTICDGGFMGGEVVGHTAPIGAGKTTLALQLFWAQMESVLAKYNGVPLQDISPAEVPRVYMFVFEPVVNLRPNLVSMAGRISRSSMMQYFKTKDLNCFSTRARHEYKDYEHKVLIGEAIKAAQQGNAEWPAGELERFKAVVEKANRFLTIADFSGRDEAMTSFASRGVDGIRDFIEANQERLGGPGVKLVIVDYVGALVSIWARTAGSRVTRMSRGDQIKEAMSLLNVEVANPFNATVWAAHQLNPEENKRGGGQVPDPLAGEGTGMFHEQCAMAFASGTLTKEGIAIFMPSKQRRAEKPVPVVCRLSKLFAQWESAQADYIIQHNKVILRSEYRDVAAANAVGGSRTNLPPAVGFRDLN